MNANTNAVMEKKTLVEEALTLMEVLQDCESYEGIDLSTVYVEDEHGNQFGGVKMVEQTLTDGSKVYNLVLTVSG